MFSKQEYIAMFHAKMRADFGEKICFMDEAKVYDKDVIHLRHSRNGVQVLLPGGKWRRAIIPYECYLAGIQEEICNREGKALKIPDIVRLTDTVRKDAMNMVRAKHIRWWQEVAKNWEQVYVPATTDFPKWEGVLRFKMMSIKKLAKALKGKPRYSNIEWGLENRRKLLENGFNAITVHFAPVVDWPGPRKGQAGYSMLDRAEMFQLQHCGFGKRRIAISELRHPHYLHEELIKMDNRTAGWRALHENELEIEGNQDGR